MLVGKGCFYLIWSSDILLIQEEMGSLFAGPAAGICEKRRVHAFPAGHVNIWFLRLLTGAEGKA